MPRGDGIAMSWFVKVEGRVYGPYTPAQMKAFVGEGRIAAHSQLSDRRDSGFRQASDIDELQAWLEEARQGADDSRTPQATGRPANFVVIADINSENGAAFTASLAHYGEIETIMDGVWLLRGATTSAALRNELSHLLDREDKLLVVDASRDRSAWFNLGRDADQNIRSLWGRAG